MKLSTKSSGVSQCGKFMRVLCLFRTTLIHVILPSVHGQQLVLVKTFNYIKIVIAQLKGLQGMGQPYLKTIVEYIFPFQPTNKIDFFCICQSRRQSSLDHLSLHNLMLRPIYRFPQILALLQVSNELLYLAVN